MLTTYGGHSIFKLKKKISVGPYAAQYSPWLGLYRNWAHVRQSKVGGPYSNKACCPRAFTLTHKAFQEISWRIWRAPYSHEYHY